MLPLMPRKPNPKPDDPAQSKRFEQAAREVEVEQDSEAFDRAFKKVALSKRAEKPPR
jgi:hypothetical protein